jgi:hypothetical protein
MMKAVRALFLSSALLILLGGCGKKPSTDLNMNITVANIVEISTLQGGIFMMLQAAEGEPQYFDIPASHQVAIPTGVFDMYFVAYLGPNPWKGQMYCGLLPDTTVEGEQIVLDISLSGGLCGTDQAFFEMDSIKNPTARWDVALWDNANWAP